MSHGQDFFISDYVNLGSIYSLSYMIWCMILQFMLQKLSLKSVDKVDILLYIVDQTKKNY